ncbi:MAG: hypothetical protein ABSB35_32610 [Bryobacteraceae bacterium]
MKLVLLFICLILLPLAAQDNDSELKHLNVPEAMNGRPGFNVRLSARNLDQSLGIIYLKGNVEIKTRTYTIVADEAEYHQDNGEIKAHGDVLAKPALPLDPRGVSQFGIK